MMRQPEDKETLEMPFSTPANPLTEKQIRDQLNKIISNGDRKAARIAREALAKRMKYKCKEAE